MQLIILGYGNMAKAILAGLLRQKKDILGITNIVIMGRNPSKITPFLESFFTQNESEYKDSITLQATNSIKCDGSEILLACKPNNLSEFSFNGVAEIVYSVLAGVTISNIKSHIDSKHFVNIMPNVAAHFGLSANAVLWEHDKLKIKTIKQAGAVLNALVDNDNNLQEVRSKYLSEVKSRIESFVKSFGNCVFVESQKELNASIATNGSSPAVLALVAQGLINAGVASGLKLESSRELVAQTFLGIAKLLAEKSPQEIKDSITSPGGTTAQALLYCDIHGVQGHIAQGLINAVKKAESFQKG
ncbi:pyrroline-5-carboxylate reductase [Helicobacter saguini]|uniref:Pyrroline-5-carboxylate reductase n=1 Tax=Helicobacter saguini TaxID=1548018 RepID=A0A347VNC8_9HELI|nr:pyrroline-5-carboxylate reductase dimerization domain-containing protein [Helicobacter saguini]MWV61817.1 pyrroline-5-carboxylate reductase [Helicobacter saguini]MWV67508.1 pyrroline-5-carboxylate reductase [Helicobacter saguini]MWV69859.1 pyrroline-5-carboxylate reductase [Helicobacter saguini]MWV72923.1 pyrroline-5-carboxylate reductase [Helicobacter saguini]TLD93275.1 pyrroline-5-carboxylate reductase [Helicobacter saguini]